MQEHASGQELTPAEVATGTAGWDEVQERIGPRCARSEQRQRVRRYVDGLLSAVERKNGWQLADHAGEGRPYGMQRLLAGAKWAADTVHEDVRAYVLQQLGDPRAVLVLDETGFLKQGTKSVGVKRQYSGTAGRIENCQIGVFLTYAAPEGHVLLDRELSLPREWADDATRRREAGVPDAVTFATKPQLAQRMLERALAAGVPAAWVTGDTIYGGDRRLRIWLEQQEQPFVLAVTSDEPLWAVLQGRWGQPRADVIAAQIPADGWQRLAAGQGAKGPRWFDWARVRLARLQLTVEERRWDHWLLVRRSRSDPSELAYYVVFAPAGTSLRTLARVAGQRWRIEQSFELAKGEVGLDHYEVRRWDGWYRHMTLAMFALAYLAVLRAHLQAQAAAPPSAMARGAHRRPRSTAQVAKGGALPATSRLDRRALAADGPRDSSCALGLETSCVSGRSDPRSRLVGVATAASGASAALSLPAPSGPRLTVTATVKLRNATDPGLRDITPGRVYYTGGDVRRRGITRSTVAGWVGGLRPKPPGLVRRGAMRILRRLIRLPGIPGRLGLVLVVALALAGCMRVDRTLLVHADGTGTYTLTFGFREPTANQPSSLPQTVVTTMEAFGTHVQQTGGSSRRYQDQGYAYWTFTRPFASVAHADTLLQEDPRQYDPSHSQVLYQDTLHITQENGLVTTRLHVTGALSLADPFGKASAWKDATETVAITLPDGIMSYQGGTRDGNTITYRIQYNQSAVIDVVGAASAPGGTIPPVVLVAGGVVALALLALLSVLVRRWGRRGRRYLPLKPGG